MSRLTVGFVLVVVVGGFGPASAETFCVDSSDSLRSAMINAAGNGEYDVIQVVEGIYLTPGAPFSYFAIQAEPGLELLGGFTAGCASRHLDPTNTVLDGQNSNQVVEIVPDSNTGGDLLFQGFTVQHGNATTFKPGGLSIGNSTGFWGSVTVEFNIFAWNQSTTGAGGIQGGSDVGLTRIENNLINHNTGGWGGGQITCNGPEFFITNNTVTDNTGTPDGGLRISGSAPTWITNNILWGNNSWDLNLGTTTPILKHNDIGTLWGTPDPSSVNNISIDPVFAGSEDYHLVNVSPAINVGWNFPAGGLPVQDLEGEPRIQGAVVDMGAYESPVLFVDDFEGGDSSDWSSTVGD